MKERENGHTDNGRVVAGQSDVSTLQLNPCQIVPIALLEVPSHSKAIVSQAVVEWSELGSQDGLE